MKFAKLSIVVFSSLMTLNNNVLAQTVPNIFQANTPAKAAEVNENFDFLANRSIGNNLVNGEIATNVDCTTDPAALNKAYANYINYRDVIFNIKGSCYGDISVKRTLDNNGNWTSEYYQIAGKSITIAAQENQLAELIPNDLSGKVQIWATFGGGLYLKNLAITVSSIAGDVGAGYSRNGHGSLTNIAIKGSSVDSGAGVFVQEGGQVYISDINISNINTGIIGKNNGAIRFLGTNNIIESKLDAINLYASSVRQDADLVLTSTSANALNLGIGTNWIGLGHKITITGRSLIDAGSTIHIDQYISHDEVVVDKGTFKSDVSFVAGNTNLYYSNFSAVDTKSSDVSLNFSKASLGNVNISSINTNNSKFDISAGTVSGQLSIYNQSFLQANGGSFNSVLVTKNSSLNGQNITIDNFYEDDNSFLYLQSSTVSSSAKNSIIRNSIADFRDVTYNAAQLNVDNSLARILGTTKLASNKLSCTNLSRVNYQGINDILSSVPSSNCLDSASITTLMSLIKTNHNLN